jgi:hypothetical protein
MSNLADAQHMALKLVDQMSTDSVGVIDSEAKLAAALIYDGLRRQGLLIAIMRDDGPHYRLTAAGRAALSSQEKS